MWFFLISTAFAVDSDSDGLSDADETLAHLPPTVADSDGDGRFDHLDSDMDGDGVPNVEECRLGGVDGLALVNGGFELPHYSGVAANYPTEGSVPGWHTTDTSFEFWTNGFLGVAPYEGTQFVELNAFAVGTLYQDIPTTLGDTYIYAYSHRGRAGNDTMRFALGPPSGTLATIRTSTDGLSWGRYGGIITIAEPLSRFAFQSVSSACGMSCGNLLDAISFTPVCDLDTDGDGTPDALETDSDGDGVGDALDLCPGEDDATADADGDFLCASSDVCPLDPFNDSDFDGVCGDTDACPGFDDADDLDFDADPDACDSDADADGIDESTDCDDMNALAGAPFTVFWDLDSDGYGGAGFIPDVCTPMPGRVSNNADCDDSDPSITLAQIWYMDRDEDGFGDADAPSTACASPPTHVSDLTDCDDRNNRHYPGASEVCDDGLDQDCDGLDTPCPVPPEDSPTDSPDADSPDADSPETGDSPDLMPECDSAEPELAFRGGWSCNTTAQGIMGGIWGAVICSVLCLMSLFRRGR